MQKDETADDRGFLRKEGLWRLCFMQLDDFVQSTHCKDPLPYKSLQAVILNCQATFNQLKS